jgi:hypothetical protein
VSSRLSYTPSARRVRNGSTLASELSQHISQLKTAGIYYRLLEEYLGSEAVDMVLAAKE